MDKAPMPVCPQCGSTEVAELFAEVRPMFFGDSTIQPKPYVVCRCRCGTAFTIEAPPTRRFSDSTPSAG